MSRFSSHVRHNLVAYVALFFALGGTAWALGVNSVRSKHIVNGQVKSTDIRDNGVSSSDVRDDSLNGDDIDEGTLSGLGTGLFSSRVETLGGNGDVFASPVGSQTAELTFNGVRHSTPASGPTYRATHLWVRINAVLTPGQTREVTLIHGGGETPLSCTVTSQSCSSNATYSLPRGAEFGLRIRSAGGPSSAQDAMISFRMVEVP